MLHLSDKDKLFNLMAAGALIITPNNRLSAALLQQYFQHHCNKTVAKPRCLPYGSALIQAYQQLKLQNTEQNHPLLLSTGQCQYLWRQIIRDEESVTFSEGLVQTVLQAWEYCLQWQISPEQADFNYTAQTKQFQHWWQLFNKQLKKIGAISEHQLCTYLIANQHILFSTSVVWVCFDDFNPQQLALQQTLTEQVCEQYRYELCESPNQPNVLAAAETKEEYQQLMAWLQAKIDKGDQRIAVVVPELQQQSRALHRMLLKHFEPSLFNISLGQSLSDFPLIAHAFVWLNLENKQLSPHEVALLLQSPYIGSAKEEFNARSQYLQDSILLQESLIPLNTLIKELQSIAPKLAELLSRLKPYPQEASAQEWVHFLQERLNSIGFPGDYGLNSENYQCFNRFSTIFDEFREFGLLQPRLTQHEVMDILQNLAQNTIFQAQKTNARIQISGLLEASGCEFDSLWVTGLTDHCLPQKTRLSAFIPHHLQLNLQMPHSLPARELLFAKQTLSRLQNGSASTVFSYSKLQGDTPNLPCSLITSFPAFEPLTIELNTEKRSQLISFRDTYHLEKKPDEQLSGGTALLANQAKCPFKAFAEHRLRAKPSLETLDGLDNRERGQIIHRVLELLWQTLGSQEELLKLDAEQLNQHLDKAIRTALVPLEAIHPDSFPKIVQDIEYTRLKRLVLQCLEWEKKRPAFQVAALEQSYTIQLANLDFKVRVDRLDQIDEKKWVIDYKSSLPNSKPWNEDRPKEPQLLLYALLDEEINTLLFMQVKAGKVSCSGLSEEKQVVSGISSLKKDENWDSCRDTWRQQLTLLAEEFQQGHCPPQPVNPGICQQCDFQNLCRFQANE